MKYILSCGLAAGCLLSLVACRDKRPEKPKSELYAELREGTAGECQVLIEGDIWMGLLPIDGPAGYQHSVYYWTTLKGTGPVYVNPIINPFNPPFPPQIGNVTVDRKKKQVTIDMQTVVPRPSESPFIYVNDANGTYPIKKINKLPFEPTKNDNRTYEPQSAIDSAGKAQAKK